MWSLARPRITSGALLAALTIAPWLSLPSARSQLAPQPAAASGGRASLLYLPVFADFDHDQQLDQAELHAGGARRCIRVRLSDSRESHLEFDSRIDARGALLAADVNRDDHHDLIWLSHSRLEPAVIWLGDGRGDFELARESAAYLGELRARLDDGADPGITGSSGDDELVWTTQALIILFPSPKSGRETRAAALPATSNLNVRRELGLYLSYLRKRGPPAHSADEIPLKRV